MKHLRLHSRIRGLGTWAHVIDEHGCKTGELRPPTEPAKLHAMLPQQNPFIHSTMIISTPLVRSVGGYRAPLDGAEDYDLWLRLSEHAELSNLPDLLHEYRRHSASASTAFGTKQLVAARLARISAGARRARRADFVEALGSPLTLSALRKQEPLRPVAELYELLGRTRGKSIDQRDLYRLIGAHLNHAERKAAQIWLRGAIEESRGWWKRSLAVLALFYLHPLRAVALMWSLLWPGRRA